MVQQRPHALGEDRHLLLLSSEFTPQIGMLTGQCSKALSVCIVRFAIHDAADESIRLVDVSF